MSKIKQFLKRLLCFHDSWAKAGWIQTSPNENKNYYVCKECGKLRNFGFETRGWIATPNLPVNFDCTYETYHIPKDFK